MIETHLGHPWSELVIVDEDFKREVRPLRTEGRHCVSNSRRDGECLIYRGRSRSFADESNLHLVGTWRYCCVAGDGAESEITQQFVAIEEDIRRSYGR